MLEEAVSNSFIVDVSTAIQYPFYFLFITPILGLNYIFNLNFQIFSVIISVISLILFIYMFKVKKSPSTQNRMFYVDKPYQHGAFFKILFKGAYVIMETLFFGLLLIFFKTNMNFVEIGIVYYLTNILGYLLIYLSIKNVGRKYGRLNKLKPLAIVMIIHSLIFLSLNLTNNSPVTMPFSGDLTLMIVIFGTAMIIAGMFVVYYLIHTLMETFKYEHSEISGIKKMNQLNNTMAILFIFTGFSFFINYILIISAILMNGLLILQVIFLIYFYNSLVRTNDKILK